MVGDAEKLDLWCETFYSCSQGAEGGLVVAPAEKASLLGSQFDSKQCCEQFVTPLSCFPQSRCNSLAFRTSVFLRLLLDPLDVFPLFLKKVADIIAPKQSIIFRRLIHPSGIVSGVLAVCYNCLS